MSCPICGREFGHASWCLNKDAGTNSPLNKGRQQCSACGGRGKVTTSTRCIMCGGSGRNLSCYLVPDPLQEHLEDKLGQPRFPCKSCNGKGVIEKETTCFVCGGTGFV